MEQVLVTGLAGMVGTRFEQLYGGKYELMSLDLASGVDITKREQVNQVISQSAAATVIHLAAYTNVSAAYEQQGDLDGACYKVNVLGTQNVAQACKNNGKYLIHVSTDFVFDGTKQSAYTEEDLPHPIEWYGETKYLAEKEVQNILDNWVILRLAYPYQAMPVRPDFLAKYVSKNAVRDFAAAIY